MLWKEICQNQLLAKTTLILFLNKVRASPCSPLSSSRLPGARLPFSSLHGAPEGRKELSPWTCALTSGTASLLSDDG